MVTKRKAVSAPASGTQAVSSKANRNRTSRAARTSSPSASSIGAANALSGLLLHGTLSYDPKTTAPGLTILAFDQDTGGENLLGQAVSDAAGQFRIEYADADFRLSVSERGGADVFFVVRAQDGHELVRTKTRRNAPRDYEVSITIPEQVLVVRGTVTDAAGLAVARARVEALDVDLRSEESLGVAKTAQDGSFRIAYTTTQFRRAEKAGADLRVRVVDRQQHELATSPIWYGAPADVEINLRLPADGAALSEFERLLATVPALLAGQGPKRSDLSLLELEPRDVAFLTRETGEVAEAIEALVAAARATVESGSETVPQPSTHVTSATAPAIPLAAFYGWYRGWPGVTAAELMTRAVEKLLSALDASATRGEIPPLSAEQREAMRELILYFQRAQALGRANEREPARLGDYLSIAASKNTKWRKRLDQRKAALHESLQAADLNDGKGTLATVAKVLGDEALAARVFAALRLGRLTGEHGALTAALHERVLDADAPAARPEVALAALDRRQWIQLAAAHGIPAGRAATVEEYAEQLHVAVERAAPVAVLVRVLETAPFFAVATGGDTSPYARLGAALGRQPEVDLEAGTVAEVARQLDLDEDATKALGALTSLRHVDLRWAETPHLIERHIDSPAVIAQLGEKGFVAHLHGVIDEERLQKIFASATAMAVGHVGMRGLLGHYLDATPSTVITTRRSGEVQAFLQKNPSLAALFGCLDQCACEPCQSVLSPSAYLADLLAYIDGQGAATARGVLEARRPDLYHLKLSCENSETVVPHIDLVNELLENAIALPRRTALSAGAAIVQAGTATPTPEVRAALAATASQALGELTALRATARPGDPYGVTQWTIADRYRQWLVTEEAEYFGFEPLATSGLNWNAAERNTLTRALDGPGIDARQLADPQVQQALRQALGAPGLPLSVVDASLESSDAAEGVTRRAIRLVAAGRITVVPGSGNVGAVTVAPQNAPGQALSFQLQDRGAVNIARDLAAGRFPDRVFSLFNEPARPKIQVEPDGTNVWIYRVEQRVTLVHRQPGIWIRGLCYQSSDANRDAAAAPQNRNPLAYALLDGPNAVYPWSLPFDERLYELRALLAATRLPRIGWLATSAAASAGLDDEAVLRERLGLSVREFDLIVPASLASAPPLHACWGYPQAAGLAALRNVAELLRRSRVSYDEFTALLASPVINPQGSVSVALPQDCRLDDATLAGVTSDAELHAFADRLHRYVRLWRRLGIPVAALDQALRLASSNAPLGAAALKGVAHLLLAADAASATLEQVLDWFDVGHTGLLRALGIDGDEFASARLVLARAEAPFTVVDPLGTPRELHCFVTELRHAQQRGQSWSELAYILHHAGPQAAVLAWPRNERLQWLKSLHDELSGPLAGSPPGLTENQDTLQAIAMRLATVLATDEAVVLALGELPLHASAAGIPSALNRLLDWLLQPSLPRDPTTSTLYADCDACLSRLHRLALLARTQQASAAQLRLLRLETGSPRFAGLQPARDLALEGSAATATSTAYAAWKQTASLFALARVGTGMTAVLEAYRRAGADTTSPAVFPRWSLLKEAFRLDDVEVVRSLAVALGDEPAMPEKRLDPLWLASLSGALATVQKTGLGAEQFRALIGDAVTDDSVAAARALLTHLEGDALAATLRRVRDQLREARRDRLIDYLLWRDELADADSLYARYLIDPQMSACMGTSRVLQATAAVQLFVQRCLLNLEPDSPPELFDASRWQWMSAFRVWEANRKVFLYPENWLYPELRDDRSEIFQSFESNLQNNEVSGESANHAFAEFLDDLPLVGQIGVSGMVQDRQTLYVVGRTDAAPHRHFWRKAERLGAPDVTWSPWRKIDLDISADHVVPFAIDGELYVAWPMFKPQEIDGRKQLEVDLAYARRTDNGWTQRLVSRGNGPLVLPPNGGSERVAYALRLLPGRDTVQGARICLYQGDGLPNLAPPADPNKLRVSKAPLSGRNRWTLSIRVRCYIRFASGKLIIDGDASRDAQIGGIRREDEERIYTRADGVVVHQTTGHYYAFRDAGDHVATQPWSNPELVFSSTEMIGEGQLSVALTRHGQTKSDVIQLSGLASGGMADVSIDFLFDGVPDTAIPALSGTDFVVMRPVALCVVGSHDEASWRPQAGDDIHAPAVSTWLSSGYQSTASSLAIFRAASGTRLRAADAPGDDSVCWYVETLDGTPAGETRRMIVPVAKATNSPLDFYPMAYNEARVYRQAASGAIGQLMQPEWQTRPQNPAFGVEAVRELGLVAGPLPDSLSATTLAFDSRRPNASYNWEVFFHGPLSAAVALSRQHRFADARRWFHYIFDPTTDEAGGGRERFWRFMPFRHGEAPPTVADWLRFAANPNADARLKTAAQAQIAAWSDNPFNPFAVARLRPAAFEWFTVIAYVRNLLDWGDQLFRRETREAIGEASLLYVMAAEILGPRPQQVGGRTGSDAAGRSRAALSYRELQQLGDGRIGSDTFGNAWIGALDNPLIKAWLQWLAWLAQHGTAGPQAGGDLARQWSDLASTGSLYFCVPPNDKLVELWDRVEERLFNIRHCRTLDGVERPLPFYEPPIDPELLIRARAQNLELPDALGERFAPIGPYRFAVLLQKANEFCGEVRSLGAALLSAIEKKESEHLSLIRSQHEIEMLRLVEQVRLDQISEAQANIEALQKSRANAVSRLTYLQRQLGDDALELDATGVPVVSQGLVARVGTSSVPGDFRGLGLIQSEIDQVARLQDGHVWSMVAGITKASAGVFHTLGAIPYNITWAPAVGHGLSAVGDGFGLVATNASFWERRAGMIAGWQRRHDDWVQQSRMTAEEIRQLDKQQLALEIRKGIAEKELANHRRQIEFANEVDDYLRHLKFSGKALHGWMESRLSSLYFSSYQLAVDIARRAEAALRHELGDESAQFRFVEFGHWDSLRKGLLAGERLAGALRRMEAAHLSRNTRRELEITRHISLRQLDPHALVALRTHGSCSFSVPEALFDLDFPGHYFRRIKTVAISLPCVVGPYTGVSGTLTLESSKLRATDSATATNYESTEKYRDSRLPVQSIATSTGQADSGLFELNFRDERYLPFEGHGAISNWKFELPAEFQPFDYDTISDLILHLRYTALGSEALRSPAAQNLKNRLKSPTVSGQGPGLQQLFSLRHDFPLAWQRLTAGNPQAATIEITHAYFPYLVRAATLTLDATAITQWLLPEGTRSSLVVTAPSDPRLRPSGPPSRWTIEPPSQGLSEASDILLAFRYTLQMPPP